MSTKRSHSKSRTGCKQCKARRIKCDETPPCCLNCTKRGITCEYQDFSDAFEKIRLLTPADFSKDGNLMQSPQGPAPKSPVSSPSESRASGVGTSQSEQFYEFTMDDLGFMHFFTLHTYQTLPRLSNDDEYHQRWQHEVPHMALSHPGLMHGLLGLAAAHQHSTIPDPDPDSAKLDEVRQHYSKALNYFLENVTNVTPGDANHLLCFVVVIGILTHYLEMQRPPSESTPLSQLLCLANVLRAATGMIRQIETDLGPFLIDNIFMTEPVARPSDIGRMDVALAFDQLQTWISQHTINSAPGREDEYAVLVDALQKLRADYVQTVVDSHRRDFVMQWLMHLTPEFTHLVEQRHPVALVLVAHWCAVVAMTRRAWYISDWPRRLMSHIQQTLQGSEWPQALDWPLREMVRQECQTDHDLA